jgi:hypothetical protein
MNKTLAALVAAATMTTLLATTVAADPITLVYRCPEYNPDASVNSCVWIGLDDRYVPIYTLTTTQSEPKCIDSENCVQHTTVQIVDTGQRYPVFLPGSYGYVELSDFCLRADVQPNCPRVEWDTDEIGGSTPALAEQLDDLANPLLA